MLNPPIQKFFLWEKKYFFIYIYINYLFIYPFEGYLIEMQIIIYEQKQSTLRDSGYIRGLSLRINRDVPSIDLNFFRRGITRSFSGRWRSLKSVRGGGGQRRRRTKETEWRDRRGDRPGESRGGWIPQRHVVAHICRKGTRGSCMQGLRHGVTLRVVN